MSIASSAPFVTGCNRIPHLHHTGKGRDKAGDESAARGASAIIGARANCRLGRSPATPLPLPRLRRPRRDALPLAADLFLR
jgi:hypothetical protein